MKKWLFIGGLGVLAIWLPTTLMTISQTEKSLTEATTKALASPKNEGAFDRVTVSYSGQEATLAGTVTSDESKVLAEDIVRHDIRLPSGLGSSLNPVTTVRNRIVISAPETPALAGAVLLPDHVYLRAKVGSEQEKAELLSALGQRYSGISVLDKIDIAPDTTPTRWPEVVSETPALSGDRGVIAFSPGQKTVLWEEGASREILKSNLPDEQMVADLWAAYEPSKTSAPAMAPDSAPKSVAYIGWGATPGRVILFGRLPDQPAKEKTVAAAKAAFPGDEVVDRIVVEPNLAAPSPFTIDFAKRVAPKKSQIGVVEPGKSPKVYPPDVFDSEIARDFSNLNLNDDALNASLRDFRVSLMKSGQISAGDPYLSLLSDGRKITLTGEVATDETKQQILAAVNAAYPGFQIEDRLSVTPLVTGEGSIAVTLQSLPKFESGQSQVAIARPGQKWRSSLVHAVYFQTGKDRSIDQERALYQVRRVLALDPRAHFEIVGNTDNAGSVQGNVKLSKERADGFVTYLKAAGIPADILSARGAGPNEPVADNKTPEGRALNRRVDVILQ